MIAAGAHDVAGVAGGDAVVDDVGVQAGQVERRDACRRTAARRRREPGPVGREVVAEQAEQHQVTPRRAPWRSDVDDLVRGEQAAVGDVARWLPREGEQPQDVDELVGGPARARRASSARSAPAISARSWLGAQAVASCVVVHVLGRLHHADRGASARTIARKRCCRTRRRRPAALAAAGPGRSRRIRGDERRRASNGLGDRRVDERLLGAKTRKMVPSAMPAASAICRVVTSRPCSRSSGRVDVDEGGAPLVGRHRAGAWESCRRAISE